MEANMNKLTVLSIAAMIILPIFTAMTFAEDLKPIQLMTPQVDGGKPLMKVLKDRSSSRSFSKEKLSAQMLSNLLWAAFGINRPDTGHRTAPSARNWQEIDIYVAMAEGLYLYDAKNHMLQPVLSGDIRVMAGTQDFVKDAPVNLIYVANFSKMGNANKDDKVIYSAADTGFISQNVYLFCSSEGLATVVRGSIDREALAKAMKLSPDQKIIIAQTLGYPKK
jgi:SagB-type dehydrogenase family enzyme